MKNDVSRKQKQPQSQSSFKAARAKDQPPGTSDAPLVDQQIVPAPFQSRNLEAPPGSVTNPQSNKSDLKQDFQESKNNLIDTKTSFNSKQEPPGILKKRANPHLSSQDFDTLSKLSKQIRSIEKMRIGRANNAAFHQASNWKDRQDRMSLYKMQQSFQFKEIRHIHAQELIQWSKEDLKALYLKQITMQTDAVLKVSEQSRLEKLIGYTDGFPLLELRKQAMKFRIYVNMYAYTIYKTKTFESISIGVILVNSITLGMEDPLAVSTTPVQDAVENVFLALYTLEMIIKVLALGFIFNKGAYLRDPWNILDFVIVMSAYFTIVQDLVVLIQSGGVKQEVTAATAGEDGLSLNSLRALRVLRPLKAVTSIKDLQILVISIIQSMGTLSEALIILFSFFVVFAIACTQLMRGILKRRCVSIENGTMLDWEEGFFFCGGQQDCPEGYFCGKRNENPNFGVTNFDNILYSLLVVFQCVTLEGWSDIMIDYMKAFNQLSYIIFLPMVFIGAFFLINLLLAVINSSFSNSSAEQQKKLEEARAKAKRNRKQVRSADDMTMPVQSDEFNVNEIGINEYWIAKKVAQQMISYLRQRQAIKLAAEIELKNRPPAEEEEYKAVVIQLPDAYIPDESNNMHDQKPEGDSQEMEHFDRQMQLLLKEDHLAGTSKLSVPKEIKMYAVNDMRIANERRRNKKDPLHQMQTAEKSAIAFKNEASTKKEPQNMSQLDDLVNIEKFLGNIGERNNEEKLSDGEHPFDLSFVHSQIADYPDFSDDEIQPQGKGARNHKNSQDDMSAIQSDSSFNEQIKPQPLEESEHSEAEGETQKQPKSKFALKRFGTQNFTKKAKGINETQNSTQLNASTTKQADNEAISALSVDETVQKKKKKRGGHKANAKGLTSKSGPVTSDEKYDKLKILIRGINHNGAFLGDKRGKDPYEYINKKTYKIVLNSEIPYIGTSMDDVFEIRNLYNEAYSIQEENRFIKVQMPQGYQKMDFEMAQIIEGQKKPELIHKEWQMKTIYQIKQEEEVEFDEDDDDALILALQPFDTVMSVGYGDYLTHKPIKFVARRSDIIVSSTLSITLTPADSQYRPLDKGVLTPEQISVWCHKRCQFRGMNVTQANLNFDDMLMKYESLAAKKSSLGDPRSQISLDRMKSSLSPNPDADGSSAILKRKTISESEAKFSQQAIMSRPRLIPPTLLRAPLAPETLNQLNDEEKRLYTIQKGKYDTYMRILEKKKQQGELPQNRKFSLKDALMIMDGKHHDEEDPDLEGDDRQDMLYFSREDTFKQQKLNDFEVAARQKLKEVSITKIKGEYIPKEIQTELDLPANLEDNQVNFAEVIKKDMSKKKKHPLWSGQEVLAIGLNNELSSWVIKRINAVRVWPKGPMGYVKKLRCLLKIMVKSSMFDSAMTLCVLLNTIVMGMERYNMNKETEEFTLVANDTFTWIFIVEMGLKNLALSPKKYLSDRMNWLDGGIVSLSIIELLINAAGQSGGSNSALKAMKVFRTLRVLRVARLLKQLKSMKVILDVIMKSASSFFYITMLLFVFVFIYTLLGMQFFGGIFDFDDGVPRGNYDTFIIGFLTVFQVLTTENWNSVLYDSMRSPEIGLFLPVIYYVSWIFVGNFILLNLFLAILIEGFVTEDTAELEDFEELERQLKAERKLKIEREKARRLKKMGAQIQSKSTLVQDWEKMTRKTGEENDVDDVDDVDEQAIREIFMDEGLIKKKDKERERRLLYSGVHCEASLYVLRKKNPFRLFAYKLSKHKLFDNTIMFLIAASSVKLAVDTYLTDFDEDSPQVRTSEAIDIFMNLMFLIEMLAKIVALGLFMDEGSYLRESWNQLDCFIVLTSMMDMMLTGVDVPVIKILRLLRTLRPLRVISHNIAMKLIVTSLFESVGAIANVIVVVVAVWMMFAIFAINIFAGKFFYCSIGKYTYHTKYECNVNGGSWLRFEQNFDDIFQAMLTLFNVASLEGWPDVMIAGVDTVENIDEGPIQENSVIMGFFFIVFILIGSFFLMNFFVGVLFMKYAEAAARETKGFTNEHIQWLAIQKMIIDQRCEHATMNKPNPAVHPRRFRAWKIVNSTVFEIGIMAIILLNILQMGITFENEPPFWTELLDISNYFFTVAFLFEMILKMQAYSWRYFETNWNRFDCFIVVTSLIDIGLEFTPSTGDSALSVAPQIARILRVLRVTRLVKLIGKNPGLQALMATITLSVGALANVFLLLLLVLFIFSILAWFFFGTLTSGKVIDGYRNFTNFGQSFLLLFVISTGENWNMLMYDCNDTPPQCTPGETCGTSYAPAFFIVFVLFVQNVMLNLFILVIIDQFTTFYMNDDNPIEKFKKNLTIFMRVWINFTVQRYRCIKLREKQLPEFLKALPMPLGLPADTTDDQMKRILLKMAVRCDDGYIYFNELLYRCMRRLYGSFRLNRKMMTQELKTQYKIYQITMSQRHNEDRKEIHEQFFSKMVGQGKSSNPFLLQMYFHISFNTWLNYARLNERKERHYIKQDKLRLKAIAEKKPFYPVEFVQDEKQMIDVSIEVEEEVFYTSEEQCFDDEISEQETIRTFPSKQTLSLRKSLTKKERTPNRRSPDSVMRRSKQSLAASQQVTVRDAASDPHQDNQVGVARGPSNMRSVVPINFPGEADKNNK